MEISTTDGLAVAVAGVSGAKALWDFILSPWLYRRAAAGTGAAEKIEALKAKKDRDGLAEKSTFLVLFVLSGLIVAFGATVPKVDATEFAALQARVAALEHPPPQ
jgi:hypothetical protein